MKVVARGLPFQWTTEALTKPVPLTVSSKAADPGAAVVGTSGLLTKGTGLVCAHRSPHDAITASKLHQMCRKKVTSKSNFGVGLKAAINLRARRFAVSR